MAINDLNCIRYDAINNKVRQYSHHAFLQSAHVCPSASRFHFEVARSILQAGRLDEATAGQILEAVLLLHRGLAIHEDVEGIAELNRQLHVLAGDYCSSRYYWLITRLGNEALVQAISDSVVRINESKMTLHRRQLQLTAEEYIELQETIHGDLLYTLTRMFVPEQQTWMEHIRSGVRAYIVHEDIERTAAPNYFTLRQAFDWVSDAKERYLSAQTSAVLTPVSYFILECWNMLRGLLEQQSFAEGNR